MLIFLFIVGLIILGIVFYPKSNDVSTFEDTRIWLYQHLKGTQWKTIAHHKYLLTFNPTKDNRTIGMTMYDVVHNKPLEYVPQFLSISAFHGVGTNKQDKIRLRSDGLLEFNYLGKKYYAVKTGGILPP